MVYDECDTFCFGVVVYTFFCVTSDSEEDEDDSEKDEDNSDEDEDSVVGVKQLDSVWTVEDEKNLCLIVLTYSHCHL